AFWNCVTIRLQKPRCHPGLSTEYSDSRASAAELFAAELLGGGGMPSAMQVTLPGLGIWAHGRGLRASLAQLEGIVRQRGARRVLNCNLGLFYVRLKVFFARQSRAMRISPWQAQAGP